VVFALATARWLGAAAIVVALVLVGVYVRRHGRGLLPLRSALDFLLELLVVVGFTGIGLLLFDTWVGAAGGLVSLFTALDDRWGSSPPGTPPQKKNLGSNLERVASDHQRTTWR
jgi:hypothetical protein